MGRAKFKIGTLVKVSNEDAEGTFLFGQVEGIVTRADGYSYQVSGFDSVVAEDEVLEAYRPVIVRKNAPAAKRSSSKNSSKSATARSRGKKVPYATDGDAAEAVQ